MYSAPSDKWETTEERYQRVIGSIIDRNHQRLAERTKELTGNFRFADIEDQDDD